MFTAVFTLMMGTVGRFFGELYFQYHLYINFVVLLYGLSILWAHNNLRTIVRRMETGIVKLGGSEKFQKNYSAIQRAFSQRWNEANKGISYFIPSQRDLWFEKIEGPQLIDVLHINDDYVKMTLHKKTGEPKASEFPQHVYLAWEDYRHNLVTGMRKKMPDPKKMEEKLKQK